MRLPRSARAIAADGRHDRDPDTSWRVPDLPPPDETADEPWASAGWAGSYSGSSVAMPSGYGPSRGKTTPGWVLH